MSDSSVDGGDAVKSDNTTTDASQKHVRGSGMLLAGRMISLGINFLVQVLIVRYLSKEGYGAFAYGYSIAMLATRMTPLGTDKAISRFIPIYHEQGELDRVKGSMFVVLSTVIIAGLLLVGSVFALRDIVGPSLTSDPLSLSVLAMIIALAPLTALENVLEKMLAIFGRVRLIFLRRYLLTPLLRLGAVVCLMLIGGNAVFLAGAYVVATAIGVLISVQILWRVFKQDKLLADLSAAKSTLPTGRLFRFGLPLLSSDVVFAVRTSLVVVLLEIFHGIAGVAAFRAVLPVARLNSVVFDSFRILYVPTASRLYAQNDFRQIGLLYWRSSAWIALLTLPVFLMSFSLATPTVVLLFGSEYASSGPILSIIAAGLYLNAAFGFNTLSLRVFDKVRTIFIIDMASGALALIGNLLVVPVYGPLGGAIVSSSVLLLQNVGYQVALAKAGGLGPAPREIAAVHLVITAVALGLLAIHWQGMFPFYLEVFLAVVATLVIWGIFVRTLEITTLFPELDRLLPKRAKWAKYLRRRQGASVTAGEQVGP